VYLQPWPLSYVPPVSLRLPGYQYHADDTSGLTLGLGAPVAALHPLQPKHGRATSPGQPSVSRETTGAHGASLGGHVPSVLDRLQTSGHQRVVTRHAPPPALPVCATARRALSVPDLSLTCAVDAAPRRGACAELCFVRGECVSISDLASAAPWTRLLLPGHAHGAALNTDTEPRVRTQPVVAARGRAGRRLQSDAYASRRSFYSLLSGRPTPHHSLCTIPSTILCIHTLI